MHGKSLVLVLTALPLPSLTLSGTWVDDFNDGNLDGWRMVETLWDAKLVIPDSGNWVVENGEAIAGDDNSWKVYMLYIGDMSWKDYTTEVSVRLLKRLEECPMNSGASLGTRFQLGEGKFGLNDYATGLYRFDRVFKIGSIWLNGLLTNDQFIISRSEANTWYRLKMTVEGNHITGFIDGIKILDLNNDLFPSGAVPIAALGVKSAFDDFMVMGPEIPDIQHGRTVKASGKLATTWANIRISAKE